MSSKSVNNYFYTPLTDSHENWKNGVLKDYYQTNEKIKSVIRKSKNSRKKMEIACDSVNTLKRSWDNFESDYGKACYRLENRIIDYERAEKLTQRKINIQPMLRQKMKRAVKRAKTIGAFKRIVA
mmetsp:Transcript_14982/g.13152  ORF Transcript_14982/g.13152 Transcript_14982/m.13152 type:complete len:125 (-) Transcript_14982:7-381(-)